MKEVIFVCLCPWLYGELGHSYIYTKHIEKAAKLHNWTFVSLLPQKCSLNDLPSNWLKTIECPTVRHWFLEIEKRPYRRPKKVTRFKERLRYYLSLYTQLKKLHQKNKKAHFVLFMEAFAQTDVALLSRLLRFLPFKNPTIGLVHRYQSQRMGSDVDHYIRHHQRIIRNGAKLKLFTDSELLKQDLEKVFNYPMQVLPIHYIEKDLNFSVERREQVSCWWPGIVREGKGLKVMQKLFKSSHPLNSQIEISLHEEASVETSCQGPLLKKLSDLKDRKDYLNEMKKHSIILLPYDDPHYEKATSSIFLEALFANRIPLVYPGTWMAYELEKENLKDLVLDWQAEDLSEKIYEKAFDHEVQKKLEQMKTKLLNFHNLETYAEVLKKTILH